jgi:phage gp46-like protein
MMDLAVIETLNGGDLQVVGNDLATIDGLENQIYLSLFGGNPGYPSKNRVDQVESLDWWGNNLLMANDQGLQFNSIFEYKLNRVTLNSLGRIELEEAAKKDLEYLSPYAKLTVSISIVSDDRIQMSIRIDPKDSGARIKIVNFRKKLDGDFVLEDFNDDFYV